jgi:cytochrome P450
MRLWRSLPGHDIAQRLAALQSPDIGIDVVDRVAEFAPVRTDHVRRRRKNIAHVTFGVGPHVLLGMPRMETTATLNVRSTGLSDLHLDAPAPGPVINGVAFRLPAALHLEVTPP